MAFDPETAQGLNRNKYYVERTDAVQYDALGQPISRDTKHDNCEYFVLDLKHDKFSKPALLAYIEACKDEYPFLAADLQAKVDKL